MSPKSTEYVQPPPCPDGGHSLQPHEHGHIPDVWRRVQRCSGRFWCSRCKTWEDGPKCRLVPPKAA